MQAGASPPRTPRASFIATSSRTTSSSGTVVVSSFWTSGWRVSRPTRRRRRRSPSCGSPAAQGAGDEPGARRGRDRGGAGHGDDWVHRPRAAVRPAGQQRDRSVQLRGHAARRPVRREAVSDEGPAGLRQPAARTGEGAGASDQGASLAPSRGPARARSRSETGFRSMDAMSSPWRSRRTQGSVVACNPSGGRLRRREPRAASRRARSAAAGARLCGRPFRARRRLGRQDRGPP